MNLMTIFQTDVSFENLIITQVYQKKMVYIHGIAPHRH